MDSQTFKVRMNFPVFQNINKPNKNQIFHMGKPENLNDNSPNSSPILNPFENLFNILSKPPPKLQKKKLYCPPTLDFSEPEIPKIEEKSFLYSTATFTSKFDPCFDDFISKSILYVFKGGENQENSWNDFKKVLHIATESIISSPNLSVLIKNGKATTKYLTGTWKKKLEFISDDLPNVELNKIIKLIDENINNEKFSFYSTDKFHYSIVTPLTIKRSQFCSEKGELYRFVFSGFMFNNLLNEILNYFPQIDEVKTNFISYI